MFTQLIKRWFFSIKNKAIEIEILYQINNKVVKFTHLWFPPLQRLKIQS